MNQKELITTFMMISNWKNPEWLQAYSKNIMVKHFINKTP